MAKRIIALNAINSGSNKKDFTDTFHVAIDRIETDDKGTYRCSIKNMMSAVVQTGLLPASGGSSLKLNTDTNELVLNHEVNIPSSTTSGGKLNIWVDDTDHVSVDAFKDTGDHYQDTGGTPIGAANYIRMLCKAPNTTEHYAAFLINSTTGTLYRPKETAATNRVLVPITSSGSNEGLEARVAALESSTGGAHVGPTPPETTFKGALWWDTNNATMYVYDSVAWVVSHPR